MLWRYSCQRTSPGFLLVRSSPAFSPGDPEQGFRSGCACRLVGEREHGVGHPALEAVVVHEQFGVVAHYHGHHVSGDRQRLAGSRASASPPSCVTTEAVRHHGRRRAERSGTTAAPAPADQRLSRLPARVAPRHAGRRSAVLIAAAQSRPGHQVPRSGHTETVLTWATPPSAYRSTPVAEAAGYRRSVSSAPPQYTSRMERSTKMRRVTVPDSP